MKIKLDKHRKVLQNAEYFSQFHFLYRWVQNREISFKEFIILTEYLNSIKCENCMKFEEKSK